MSTNELQEQKNEREKQIGEGRTVRSGKVNATTVLSGTGHWTQTCPDHRSQHGSSYHRTIGHPNSLQLLEPLQNKINNTNQHTHLLSHTILYGDEK